MQGRGPKGARGPLFLDPKKFLETTPPPFPALSQGLDLALL